MSLASIRSPTSGFSLRTSERGGHLLDRGPHPEDAEAFDERTLPRLRTAVHELSWLLERGYTQRAALILVGDHHQLTARQRNAVWRCAAPDTRLEARRARRVELRGPLVIDTFNVLLTVERALGGGPVLVGRDGAWRDLGGVHGNWRSVGTTAAALQRLAAVLAGIPEVVWVLDRPVSNAGRLAAQIRELGSWEVRLEHPADAALRAFAGVVATSDAGVMDAVQAWTSLEPLATTDLPVWKVPLGDDERT